MLLDSQSRPSYNPSPDVAQVLWMYLSKQYIATYITKQKCNIMATSHYDGLCVEYLVYITSDAGEVSAVQAYQ
jgi:hypothetical protein